MDLMELKYVATLTGGRFNCFEAQRCHLASSFGNSEFCPHGVFMSFVRLSEQRAIISLSGLDKFVFLMGALCNFLDVGSEFLNAI
jgi:hypothetical protein